jgi:hypothetical protein
MGNGDTFVTEMVCIAVAKQLWPATSAAYADAVAARRLTLYRMHTEGSITLTNLRTNAEAMEYLQLMRVHRTEQEAALANTTSAGKSPNPPADWKDSPPGGS